jgi:hypothetical protein
MIGCIMMALHLILAIWKNALAIARLSGRGHD